MRNPLNIERDRLVEFCRRNHIRRLCLFGSVLSDRFRPDSDVDMLVEFEEGVAVTLLDMARMERELTHLVGRQVDMRTPKELSRYFRDKVLATAEVQYAG
jgi:predicted nucleotidyltransferase